MRNLSVISIGVYLTAFIATTFAVPAIARVQGADSEVFRTPGRISRIVLYRDQALVTRDIEIEAGKHSQIVVEGLPPQVNPQSLFAEGNESIVVRATQFSRRPVIVAPQEDVREKQSQIAKLDKQQQSITSQQSVLTSRLEYLSKLEGFVAPTAMGELSHGVLNAETLKSMTEFQSQQRTEIAMAQLELQQQAQEIQQQVDLLQREIAAITNQSTTEAIEGVIFLAGQSDQPSTVRISYLVSGCGWSPSYTLRAHQANRDATLEYNAMIQQFSGEDWSDVQLTLSTASPTLSAMRPAIAAHRLTLTSGQAQQQQEQVAQTYNDSKAIQFQANSVLRNAIDFNGNARASLTLNLAIEDLSTLELNADPKVLKSLAADQSTAAEQPSISYSLADLVTLTNRLDQQIIRVAHPTMPTNSYLVATPILTSLVFREAELANQSQLDLLAGPILVYLDDQFVGRTEIPSVARGQKFVVGLGAATQLRTKREVIDRTEETQGGNRRIVIRYRLKVENFANEKTSVRLLDRVPLAADASDIQVKLNDGMPKLSEDPIYAEIERPEGILRWDVEAKGSGKIAQVEYGYSIEFDRQYSLTKATDRQSSEQEFQQNLLRRNRY
jgi:uncharacterized protein (TIGR02231 family)